MALSPVDGRRVPGNHRVSQISTWTSTRQADVAMTRRHLGWRSSIVHVPKPETTMSVEDKDAEEVENVINLLEEDPSVQDVYINAVW